MSLPEERLRDLKEALLLGDPLDAEQRLALLAALDHLSQLAPARRGRPANAALHLRAGVVGVLHEKNGLPIKVALFAAAPKATARERDTIERTYRALRATGGRITVPAAAVRAALDALGRA